MIMRNLPEFSLLINGRPPDAKLQHEIDTAPQRIQAMEILFPRCWAAKIPHDIAHKYVPLELMEWSGLSLSAEEKAQLTFFRVQYNNLLSMPYTVEEMDSHE